MIDTIGVERRGPAFQAVDFIPFGKEQFGQVGAVLAGDAGNQRFFMIFKSTRFG
jgi:hypothetical protein